VVQLFVHGFSPGWRSAIIRRSNSASWELAIAKSVIVFSLRSDYHLLWKGDSDMDIEQEWYSQNPGHVHRLANHLAFDLDSAFRDFCSASDVQEASFPPGLINLLDSFPKSAKPVKAKADIDCTLQIFALMLVREAERCNVPLPGACENVADWLVNSFLPAYKASFPKEL
jgi:hypothetical protein